ncbi:MAG: hypothetical protein M1334_03210, partial [Patescibacteria group bacterium]|nr:hypothetical protein [Patescibacteria group bacterium]
MKKAKTFGGLDGQTAKFLAVINENTPRNLTTREMQYWINRPMELKKILENLRVPDNTAPRFTCWKK